MARIRTIKPEFFTHEDLYEAEKESGLPLRVAFAGLFTCADRMGRFKWKPKTLKLAVLPHDDVDFSRVLHALATRGLLVRYECITDGKTELYGVIPTFLKHQVINHREAPSVLPEPPSNVDLSWLDATREAHVIDAWSTREARGMGMPGGKGREGKGKERKGTKDKTHAMGARTCEASSPDIFSGQTLDSREDAIPEKQQTSEDEGESHFFMDESSSFVVQSVVDQDMQAMLAYDSMFHTTTDYEIQRGAMSENVVKGDSSEAPKSRKKKIGINSKFTKPFFDAKQYLESRGVNPQAVDDWLELRKKKNAPPTQTAILMIEKESENAGISLDETIKTCCSRGWQGFRAEWILSNSHKKEMSYGEKLVAEGERNKAEFLAMQDKSNWFIPSDDDPFTIEMEKNDESARQ